MRKLNEWEESLRDVITNSDKFYFIECFYENLNRIKKLKGTEYAYHIFDLMCRYALYEELPKENVYPDEEIFFSNIIKDYIDIGKEMIEDRRRNQLIRTSQNGYVYILHINGYYKIGRTTNSEKRFGEYTKLMEQPETICCVYVEKYKQVEKKLHMMFKNKNTNGEWFNLSNDELSKAINYIKDWEISEEQAS